MKPASSVSGAEKSTAVLAPLVSVVVTTKNEERNIEWCLRSIELQTWPNIEIIVVDNNSTDQTKPIAASYTPNVFNKGPERSAQRNFGMLELAKGDYVIYVDADMILSPLLVERCVQKMAEPGCLALHIPEIILGSSFWCRVRRFERTFYDGTVIDGARFFRQGVFRKIGGFNEKINAAEDWDADKRIKKIGGTIALIPRRRTESTETSWELSYFVRSNGVRPIFETVIYHNESDFSLKRYLLKKKAYTGDVGEYVRMWGKNDPDVRRQVGFFYRYVGVFVENGKWKKLVTHPLLTIGMYVLRGCVGAVFLWKKISA